MNISFTRTEIDVDGTFFPRAQLLPEIGVKAYPRQYPQRTLEEKIAAYKAPGNQKIKIDYEAVIAQWLIAN